MSKLSDLLGGKKKKKKEPTKLLAGQQYDNITIYRLKEPSQNLATLADRAQNNNQRQSQRLSIAPGLPQTDPEQRRASRAYPVPDVQPQRLSQVQGTRLSLVNPNQVDSRRPSAIQYGMGPAQRMSMVQQGPGTRLSMVNPNEVNARRTSAVQYGTGLGQNREVRFSVVKPVSEINENPKAGRLSVVKPLDQRGGFPLNSGNEPVIYAVRRSSVRPTNQPLSKKPFGKKTKQEDERSEREIQEMQREYMQERQREQAPTQVYAANVSTTMPTRGRAQSVLQQSVKTLTSKNEESYVPKKNIRYSVDTDVFSSDAKKRSDKTNAPGYVTMERGQGMLVSDFLNPITSIFVTDLKDPVPKDPLNKPREFNNWGRQRQSSVRQVVTPGQRKPQQRVSVVRAATPARGKPVQQYYDDDDDESEESYESYNERSNNYRRQQNAQRVYAARMPSMVLPGVARAPDTDNSPLTPPPRKKLPIGEEEEKEGDIKLRLPNARRLSQVEKIEIADTVKFLVNPPPDVASLTGSEVRSERSERKRN